MTTGWMSLVAFQSVSGIVAFAVAVIVWRRRRTLPSLAPGLLLVMVGIIMWSAIEVGMRIAPTHEMRAAFVGCLALPIPALVSGFYFSARSLADPGYKPATATLVLHLANFAVLVVALLVPATRPYIAGTAVHTRGYELAWHASPLFWAQAVVAALGLTVGTIIDVRALSHAAVTHRNILMCHLGGALAPALGAVILAGTMISHGGWMFTNSPDLMPVAFAGTALVNVYSVTRQGMMAIAPVARGLVLEELTDAIFIFDTAGHLVDRNGAAITLLAQCGYRPNQITREHGFHDVITRMGPHVRPENGEYPIASVPVREVDLRVSDVKSEGRIVARSLVVRDVTGLARSRRELAQANDRLRDQIATIDALRAELLDQATRDALTGVPNRRSLEAALAQLHADAVVSGRSGRYSVAVVDIDHFKSVNDTYGHLVGDEILVAVAGYLSDVSIGDEQVYRFGGEEFVVLLPGAGRATALARASAYLSACRRRDVGSVKDLNLTTSIGVATFPDDGVDTTEVLAAADTALYRAKTGGRNRVEQAELAPVAVDADR